MSASEPFDLDAIVARTFRTARPKLASALTCVLAMPEDLARSAAQSTPEWNDRTGWLSWTDPAVGPQRFRLDRGHFDPASAWEAVVSHELVPESWFDDPSRRFITRSLGRALLDRSMAPRRLPHPHTLRACVVAAANASSMIAAERLCIEAWTALRPWSNRSATPSFLWQFDDEAFFAQRWQRFALHGAAEATDQRDDVALRSDDRIGVRATLEVDRAAQALAQAVGVLASLSASRAVERSLAPYERLSYSIVAEANRWAEAEARDERIRNTASIDPSLSALESVAFSSLPNPFAPLAEVFSQGFVVAALFPVVHIVVCED